MSEIQFPSPTTFLTPSLTSFHTQPTSAQQSAPAPLNGKRKAAPISKGKSAKSAKEDIGTKPKQSKSRNGCTTCKQKRLKCDETKPTCTQCSKRNVECGGYKKDWKWKEFNECMVVNKPPAPAKSRKAPTTASAPSSAPSTSFVSAESKTSPSSDGTVGTPEAPTSSQNGVQTLPSVQTSSQEDHRPKQQSTRSSSHDSTQDRRPFSLGTRFQNDEPPTPISTSGLTPHFAEFAMPHAPAMIPPMPPMLQSPTLSEILLPTEDLQRPMGDIDVLNESEGSTEVDPADVPMDSIDDMDGDDVEEMERVTDASYTWIVPPNLQDSFISSNGDPGLEIPLHMLNRRPVFAPISQEMLMSQFNRFTCGILSVRDGQRENPWRNLIYPMVNKSEALYHAIASMSALHNAQGRRDMKLVGVEHRTRSIELLSRGISTMDAETAISITLVLAFGESWDDVDISTGYRHLQGAKSFMSRALATLQRHETNPKKRERIKFLCNTWVYMDVIARLTSVEGDDSEDFDSALCISQENYDGSRDVDPLMGCAATMFPIIGRVANLVRRVRVSSTTSISDIQQAVELKKALERWRPPYPFNEPDDDACDVEDALKTAEAYRWATLLYLHQTFPQIPSLTSQVLAKKVLYNLAMVGLGSRAIIVQIYPLLVAGCEVTSQDDRKWVRERWAAMSRMMRIGNIDRCHEVVEEVWSRRDRHDAELARRQRPRNQPPLYGMRNGSLPNTFHSESPDPFQQDSPERSPVDFGRRNTAPNQYDGQRERHLHSPRNFSIPVDGFTGTPLSVSGPSDDWGLSSSGPRPRTNLMEVEEHLPIERTVTGSQHWTGVMMDWNWEVLLG